MPAIAREVRGAGVTTWETLKARINRQRMTDQGACVTTIDVKRINGTLYLNAEHLVMYLRSEEAIGHEHPEARGRSLTNLADQLEKLGAACSATKP